MVDGKRAESEEKERKESGWLLVVEKREAREAGRTLSRFGSLRLRPLFSSLPNNRHLVFTCPSILPNPL